MNHTVDVLVPPANQAGVRWYEVQSPGSAPTIFQQGTYAPDTDNRWMGSIAMDNSGNMALGYSKSSAGIFPEIDITGRLSGDAPGTMGTEAIMKAGLGSQTGGSNRWGDYTAMAVDQRDGCTFWYTNQYQPANGTFNWSTRMASFRFRYLRLAGTRNDPGSRHRRCDQCADRRGPGFDGQRVLFGDRREREVLRLFLAPAPTPSRPRGRGATARQARPSRQSSSTAGS